MSLLQYQQFDSKVSGPSPLLGSHCIWLVVPSSIRTCQVFHYKFWPACSYILSACWYTVTPSHSFAASPRSCQRASCGSLGSTPSSSSSIRSWCSHAWLYSIRRGLHASTGPCHLHPNAWWPRSLSLSDFSSQQSASFCTIWFPYKLGYQGRRTLSLW